MKAADQQKSKAPRPPSIKKTGISCLGDKKIAKRNGRRHRGANQAEGHSKELMHIEHPSPSTTEEFCPKIFGKGAYSSEAMEVSPECDMCPVKTLDPRADIKLQLFPLDEDTRMGMQKEGYYPYLELTLKARKRISSVLRHLYNKWGSASFAAGEVMLLPYHLPEVLSTCRRWTLNDTNITAGDVHAAIGSPAKFRLRYGWFSSAGAETSIPATAAFSEGCLKGEGASENCSSGTEDLHSTGEQTMLTCKWMNGAPSTTIPTVPLQHEVVPGGCTTDIENFQGIMEQTEAPYKESKPGNMSEPLSVQTAEQMSFNAPVNSVDSGARLESGPGQTSAVWVDDLSNLSIGGLLSEASLQGIFNYLDSRSKRSNTGLQPSEIISDSFDAIIASQIHNLQGPRPSAEPHSILDAEATCNPFSYKERSSSKNTSFASIGSSCPPPSRAEMASKPSKLSSVTQGDKQEEHLQQDCQESETNLLLSSQGDKSIENLKQDCQESETDLELSIQVYDESTLGLTNIKWAESNDAFNLAPSSSQKVVN